MTALDLGPDVAGPDLDRATAQGPTGFGPRPDLLRFGWASAVLERFPRLHLDWATSPDRAVRRAIMRSPDLPPIAAEAVVAARRSGLHTLGGNPVAPAELLHRNPGAQRRRRAVDQALGADGLRGAERRPDRPGLVDVGSATVDLVLARSDRLGLATAQQLVGRTSPRPDPWVLARLAARFGDPLWSVVEGSVPADRRRAAAALAEVATAVAAEREASTPAVRPGR